jgi:hypothetical protein
MMPLAFFENANAMALSNHTRLQLASEGILIPDDFKDFDDNGLEAIFLILAKPLKVPGVGARLVEVRANEVSAKSKMRLKGAMKIAKFYENINRDLDPQNMTWMVIKHFLDQWKTLMERKKEDHGLAPKLTKSCPVHKWLESFHLHLGKKVGVRNAPLSYVVRAVADVPAIAPPHQAGEPHSEENELIEGNMAACMSHTHALYKIDNGLVFDLIENAVSGSNVTSTIAPFHKTRNGRGAMNVLKTQHAGEAIWDRLVKEAEHILSNKIWSCNTPTTLSQHMGTHCHAYITLTECSEHIPVDVPNDQAHVSYEFRCYLFEPQK